MSDPYTDRRGIGGLEELGERISGGGVAQGRLPAGPFVWATLGAALAMIGVYWLLVRTAAGQRVDQAAFLGARRSNPSESRASTWALSHITTRSLFVVLVILVLIGVLRRRPLVGLGAALAAGLAVVVADLTKDHLLTRPELIPGLSRISNSFPSGHTAVAVSCAVALVLVVPPRWRGLAAVIAGGYGWATAAEVQTAGWHRPSDAIGGSLLAFGAVTAMAAILAATGRLRSGPPKGHLLAHVVLLVVAAGVTLLGAVKVISTLRYFRTHTLFEAGPGILHDAYLGGLAATVDVVVVLLMLLLALLRRAD